MIRMIGTFMMMVRWIWDVYYEQVIVGGLYWVTALRENDQERVTAGGGAFITGEQQVIEGGLEQQVIR